MADWQIRKFVDEKSDWLYAHLREMEQNKIGSCTPESRTFKSRELQVLADEALRVIPERYSFMPCCRRDLRQDHHTKPAYTLGKLGAKGNLNFNCLLMKAPPEVLITWLSMSCATGWR